MSKVSILLPTYNRQDYLKDSIESVLAQTHQDWELLISDNCSQDSTFQLAQDYAKKDERIVCWQNETNIGALQNYNKCIAKAAGDYIELFGADDIFEPRCIEVLTKALDENTSVALATSAKRHINENGKAIREDRLRGKTEIISAKEVISYNLSNLSNAIISPVMFRTKHKGSGFDMSLGNCADIEYWNQILQFGDLFYSNEVLFNYRIHNGSETTRTLADLEFAILLLRIAERNKDYLVRKNEPDILPYKIVIEKLLDIVDYGTNYLKLDFSPFIGNLGQQDSKQQLAKDDLHDFKRIAYLSLLYTVEMRKELEWLRGKCNELAKESDPSKLKHNDTWKQHNLALQESVKANKDLQEQVNQLSTQLNSLLNSKSWKITAPLRMVKRQVSINEH